MKNIFLTVSALSLMVLLLPSTAYAYIDPGSGSIFLQTLAVVFVAIAGAWVGFKNKISSFFQKKKDEKDQDE